MVLEGKEFLPVKEDPMQVIERMLQELEAFETMPVVESQNTVASTLIKVKDAFKSGIDEHPHVLLILYGSLLYGDPQKLDIDIAFVASGSLQIQDADSLFQDAESKLLYPDFISMALEDVKEIAKEWNNETISLQKEYYVGYLADVPGIIAAAVLSGKPLFKEQQALYDTYRQEIRQIVEQTPRLQQGVIENLQLTLTKRRLRRGM